MVSTRLGKVETGRLESSGGPNRRRRGARLPAGTTEEPTYMPSSPESSISSIPAELDIAIPNTPPRPTAAMATDMSQHSSPGHAAQTPTAPLVSSKHFALGRDSGSISARQGRERRLISHQWKLPYWEAVFELPVDEPEFAFMRGEEFAPTEVTEHMTRSLWKIANRHGVGHLDFVRMALRQMLVERPLRLGMRLRSGIFTTVLEGIRINGVDTMNQQAQQSLRELAQKQAQAHDGTPKTPKTLLATQQSRSTQPASPQTSTAPVATNPSANTDSPRNPEEFIRGRAEQLSAQFQKAQTTPRNNSSSIQQKLQGLESQHQRLSQEHLRRQAATPASSQPVHQQSADPQSSPAAGSKSATRTQSERPSDTTNPKTPVQRRLAEDLHRRAGTNGGSAQPQETEQRRPTNSGGSPQGKSPQKPHGHQAASAAGSVPSSRTAASLESPQRPKANVGSNSRSNANLKETPSATTANMDPSSEGGPVESSNGPPAPAQQTESGTLLNGGSWEHQKTTNARLELIAGNGTPPPQQFGSNATSRQEDPSGHPQSQQQQKQQQRSDAPKPAPKHPAEDDDGRNNSDPNPQAFVAPTNAPATHSYSPYHALQPLTCAIRPSAQKRKLQDDALRANLSVVRANLGVMRANLNLLENDVTGLRDHIAQVEVEKAGLQAQIQDKDSDLVHANSDLKARVDVQRQLAEQLANAEAEMMAEEEGETNGQQDGSFETRNNKRRRFDL